MFDLDAGKLLVFGIVALAVIPPKDLPRVLRTVGKYVGQMRRMASDFQGQFMEAMKEHGIAVGVHYPAIHLFSAYKAMGYREGQFPNAERIGRQTVTLPLFPTMELTDVDRVVAAVTQVLRGGRR